jgi:glycosyltransferase involved in cell wall biosynthesis
LKIDIIIPVYNPIINWEINLVENYLQLTTVNTDHTFHFYLINDGSSSGLTIEHIQYIKENIKHFTFIDCKQNSGKGNAIRHGVAQSTANYIIYTDIDFPYTMDSFNSILNTLLTDTIDIAVGVRPNIYYNDVPKFRIILSKGLRFFNKNILRLKVYDTQCGLKGFNSRVKHYFLNTRTKRYLFDLEFLLKTSRINSIVTKPVEVYLKPNIVFSKMNLAILFHEIKSLIQIVN